MCVYMLGTTHCQDINMCMYGYLVNIYRYRACIIQNRSGLLVATLATVSTAGISQLLAAAIAQVIYSPCKFLSATSVVAFYMTTLVLNAKNNASYCIN